MQTIKRALRAKNKPFEQIINRICEREQEEFGLAENKLIIKTNKGNNCFLLKSGSVVLLISNISKHQFLCRRFESKEDFYSIPCRSSDLHVYVVSNLAEVSVINVIDIEIKCWLIPFNGPKFVCMPMSNWNEK